MLFCELGNYLNEVVIFGNIVFFYLEWGEKDKVLNNFEEVLKIIEKWSDFFFRVNILNNIGELYFDLVDKNKVLEYYE